MPPIYRVPFNHHRIRLTPALIAWLCGAVCCIIGASLGWAHLFSQAHAHRVFTRLEWVVGSAGILQVVGLLIALRSYPERRWLLPLLKWATGLFDVVAFIVLIALNDDTFSIYDWTHSVWWVVVGVGVSFISTFRLTITTIPHDA